MFASNNFTQFAALDDAGIAYILQEVEVPSLYRWWLKSVYKITNQYIFILHL